MKTTIPHVYRLIATRLFGRWTAPRGAARLAAPLDVTVLEARENPAGTYSGVVFQDFDSDGILDTTASQPNAGGGTITTIGDSVDRGLGGATVTAYTGANTFAGSVTVAPDGAFSFVPGGSGPYRFEFTALPAGFNPGPAGSAATGTVAGTTVQFRADGGATNLNLGLVRPADYNQQNPLLLTPRYNYGDQTNSAEPAIVSFRYNAGGLGAGANYTAPVAREVAIPASRVGTTYALAYNRQSRELYAGAYFKRHAGFGPNGTGAIYRAPIPAGTLTNYDGGGAAGSSLLFADLNTIYPGSAGPNRHDTADYDRDNNNTAWEAVGKTSLGGIDVSDDGQFLFVMNLADRRLYKLPTSGALNTTTVARQAVPLQNFAGTTAARFHTADVRPFAVQYHQGKVYVGVVYTAQTEANNDFNNAAARAELTAAVYEVDPTTLAFSAAPVFTADLGYDRAESSIAFGETSAAISRWRPWTSEYFTTTADGRFLVAPQPMLSDITFDEAGNMTLGLRDRGGDQGGLQNLSRPGSNTTIEAFTTGDVLRAFINTPNDLASGWVLESNARGGGVGAQAQNNSAGPGGGEFYDDDYRGGVPTGNLFHGETSMGAVLQLAGRPDLVTNQMDPGSDTLAGGASWFSTSSGAKVKGYQVYRTTSSSTTTFSKANGLGGLVAILDEAPIEIGNRVFRDENGDGVQGANEAGVAGVSVELLNATGTAVLATAVTDATGNYFFSSAAGTSTASHIYALALARNTGYRLRVRNATGASQQGALRGSRPTAADQGGNDSIDSDGVASGDDLIADLTTGAYGDNDHAYDFGVLPYSLGNRVWLDRDDSGTINALDTANPGIASVTVRLYLDAAGDGTPDSLVATTTTDSTGHYRFDGLAAGTYIVEVDRASATLANLVSSTGGAGNPNDDVDSDDNGTVVDTAFVRSGPVTLGTGTPEPTNETDIGATDPPAANASSNLSVDFGFITPRSSVAGEIYYDANNDGVLNNGEGRILVDTTVTLTGTDLYGNPFTRSTTTNTGAYLFTGLLPAQANTTYTLTQTANPAGYLDGKDRVGTLFGGAAATVPASAFTGLVIPNNGLANNGVGYDFGELKAARLGNRVWLDANGDGVDNNGEQGVEGVTVVLTGTDDLGAITPITTLTGANGLYAFEGLRPGKYFVSFGDAVGAGAPFVRTRQDAGADDAADSDAAVAGAFPGKTGQVTLAAGDSNQTIDAGLYRPVSVGNYVWIDANKNGVVDGGELPVTGAKVTLVTGGADGDLATAGDNETQFTFTGTGPDAGQYLFTGLAPNNFRVTVDVATGKVNGQSAAGAVPTYDFDSELVGPDATTKFGPLASGANFADADFGFRLPGSIGDFVWLDANKNGVQDKGEPGLAGLTVTLVNPGADGKFDGAGDTTLTAVTDKNGFYQFTGLPVDGVTYRVSVSTAGTNFVPTYDLNGPLDRTADAKLELGTPARADVDFGFTGAGKAGDLVWYDIDGDGKKGQFEPGIEGAVVQLTWAGADGQFGTGDDLTRTTATDADGKYLFQDLPLYTAADKYRVSVTPAAAFPVPTFDSDGTGTANTSDFTLGAGGENLAQDFGYRGAQGLGNFVWLDANGNGKQDGGEAGVNNVQVELLDLANNVLAKTFTAPGNGGQGFYQFVGLAPGQYRVRFTATDGTTNYTRTRQDAGANDALDSDADPVTGVTGNVTVAAGLFNPDVDAGLYVPLSLGDLVWLDLNRDGKRDAGEPGVENAKVTLTTGGADGDLATAGDNVTLVTFTGTGAKAGFYEFAGLAPNSYLVAVDTKGSFVTTGKGAAVPVVGAVATYDRDGTTLTPDGSTDAGFLPSGANTPDLDFGFAPPLSSVRGQIYYDANNNNIRDGVEDVITAPTTITLTGVDVFGNPVSLTTTTTSGEYAFTGLLPSQGTYTLTQSAEPAGYLDGQDRVGTLLGGAAGKDAVTGRDVFTGLTVANDGVSRDGVGYDFGELKAARLGNRVWLDANGDGVDNNGEQGVVGVRVVLTGTNDLGTIAPVETFTGANGLYLFDDLRPGNYTVSFGNADATTTYFRTAQNAPGADAETDSDASQADGATAPVGLAAGETNLRVDAGLYLPASLGDTLFYDADNSGGPQNAGDPGINGVTVTLDYAGLDGVFGQGGDDVIGFRTTATGTVNGKAGVYGFAGLAPGVYRVNVAAATLPGGLAPRFDLDGVGTANTAGVTLASGQNFADADFGYAGTGSIGDTLWYDLDRSGTQNNNEPGVAGVGVTLTFAGFDGQFGGGDDVTYASQVTVAGGKYGFGNLPAGLFRVDVDAKTLPAGVVNVFDLDNPAAGANNTAVAALLAGENRPDVDFGYAGTGFVGDFVYLDINGDGAPTPGEPGLAGVTVTLTWFGPDGQPGGGDDVTLTQVTGKSGAYGFGDLPPGTYTVGLTTLPPGVTQTGDPDAALDGATLVALTPGQRVETADFGYQGNTSIAGTVYVDSNNNGRRDPGEAPIAGVRLTLTGTDAQGNAVQLAATTDAGGAYLFEDLVPGVYAVSETQPGAYGDGLDALGTVNGAPSGAAGNDAFTGIELAPGGFGVGYDFGERPGGVSGVVFYDADRDGVRDPGEPGLANVIVTLRGPDGVVVATATTGPDGAYRFGDLPAGVYTVEETQPGAYGDSPSGPGAPNVRSVAVPPGVEVADQNFGDTLGSLAGSVYVDDDLNGVRGPGEPGIGGVLVRLVDLATGVTLTATTAADGSYQFSNLPAGGYRLVETQPRPNEDGQETAGSFGGTVGNDVFDGVALPPGGVGVGYNFGERGLATVSGAVFVDANRDGVRDPGDRPSPGVTVQLLNPAGQVVATTTTGPDGGYLFADVPVGVYTLREIQPAGFGDAPGSVNDRLITVGRGGVSNVNFGDTLGSLAGRVYLDTNLSATLDNTGRNPDRGLAGITVTLLDAAGRTVATAVTNAAGEFLFADLPAGRYTLVQSQPPLPTTLTDGFFDGADTLGSLGGAQPVKNRFEVDVAQGAVGTGYHFGELPPADPFGFVYEDVNRNGVRDPGEPGIAGVAVTISGTAFAGTPFARPLVASDLPGNSLTVLTDAAGRYEFVPLPPGLYSIREAQPAGYLDGQERDGDANGPAPVVGDDVFSDVRLAPFPIRGPFDFGEFRAAPTPIARVRATPTVVGPLLPMDFFPATPGAASVMADATKREFLSSTGPRALTVPSAQAVAALSSTPAFTDFRAPATTYLVAAQDAGGGVVRVFDFTSGVERFRFQPFGDFTGGVRVATADVTGDGLDDIIAAPGAGGGPVVRVFDGATGREVMNLMAFESGFRGGLQVAAADITGDGVADLIVTPDEGGGPIVRAFDGRTGATVANFFALDETFRGGLRIAAGDLNRDGFADLVVTAGVGGGPRVAGYDGRTLTTTQARLFADYFAFAPELRSGFWVSTGDVDGDGYADLVLSAGAGGGPRAVAYSGQALTQANSPRPLADFFAGDAADRSGVRTTAKDLNGDGRAEIVAAGGLGSRAVTTIFDPLTGAALDSFTSFPTDFTGGVYLG